MGTNDLQTKSLRRWLLSCAGIGAMAVATASTAAAVPQESPTATPIKHVIIIIGENRTFDHVFATYTPVNRKDTYIMAMMRAICRPARIS